MNTRLIRWLTGAALALGIAWSLLARSTATRAAPTAALPMTASAATAALAATTATTFTVNTAVDAVYEGACINNTPQQCSLREAILEANRTTGATILLPGLAAGQVYALTIPASGFDDGTSGDLNIDASMSIIGKPTISDPSVIVDARLSNDRVLTIACCVTVSIANLTVQHGAIGTFYAIGGGILNGGTLTLSNSTVSGNAARLEGGGIYNGGRLTLSNSRVFSNTAAGDGGGIVNSYGTLTLTDSIIVSNTANVGGGIYNDRGATMTLSNSTVFSNTAFYGIGGGIYNGGTLALGNSTVSGNTASTYGGGLFSNIVATMTLSTSTVDFFPITPSGGGVYNEGTLTLTDSIVSGNTADAYGGGIQNSGTLTLIGSTVSGNTAANGGGIGSVGRVVMLVNSTVSSNTASGGGGIIINNGGGIISGGAWTLIGSTVISNTAGADGGGIGNNGALTLIGSTVNSNTASLGEGGGVNNHGSLLVTNSTLSGNTAATGGGIFSDHAGALTYSTLNGNAATTGGGIYQSAQLVSQTLALSSTIVANSPSGGNCATDAAGFPLSSNGYNLSSDGTCAAYFTRTGDLNNTDPHLGPLANNGGPTLTHLPQPPSAVIDAIPLGANGCGTTLTTDQRGLTRPINGKCDMGAVEYVVLAPSLWLPLIVR